VPIQRLQQTARRDSFLRLQVRGYLAAVDQIVRRLRQRRDYRVVVRVDLQGIRATVRKVLQAAAARQAEETEGDVKVAKEKTTKWTTRKMLDSLAQDRRFMTIVAAWGSLTYEQKDELVGTVET